MKWIVKYWKDNKAFEEFVPEWDKGRGMYDRFAKELNLWYEKGIAPQDCDGDTAYFLKLQKERLDKKGLKRPKEPATEQARYRENLSGTQRI